MVVGGVAGEVGAQGVHLAGTRLTATATATGADAVAAAVAVAVVVAGVDEVAVAVAVVVAVAGAVVVTVVVTVGAPAAATVAVAVAVAGAVVVTVATVGVVAVGVGAWVGAGTTIGEVGRYGAHVWVACVRAWAPSMPCVWLSTRLLTTGARPLPRPHPIAQTGRDVGARASVAPGAELLFGRHSCELALLTGSRHVHKAFVVEGGASTNAEEIAALATEADVPVETLRCHRHACADTHAPRLPLRVTVCPPVCVCVCGQQVGAERPGRPAASPGLRAERGCDDAAHHRFCRGTGCHGAPHRYHRYHRYVLVRMVAVIPPA